LYFGILPDLDESGAGSKKIRVAEIPEIGFVLKTCVLKELAVAILKVPGFVQGLDFCSAGIG
jgi:hypothetical protein